MAARARPRWATLTPERAPAGEQTWHTYPPVRMPSAAAVIDALTRPETWPDYATEIGRFTPLRPGGLAGQTFEIEVAAGTATGRPMFTRGYVTVTDLVTPDDPAALRAWFAALEDGLERYGDDEPRAVPEGGEPLVGLDLTTHHGHFMGSGHNRLLLYTHEGEAWVRAAGTWDPMPWHIDRAYRLAGSDAQHAFWGQGEVESQSMLHQLAAAAVGVIDAIVVGSGPNGLAAAIRLAEAGRSRRRARGRRRARRRGAHRGADAAGLPPRHVLLGLPGGRRLAGVRADAAGRPRAGMGPPRRLLGAPAAGRARRRALPRPRRHGGEPRRAARGRRRALGAVRPPVPRRVRGACARRCSPGFPPLGGPLALLAAHRPAARAGLRPAAARVGRRRSAARLFEGDDARAWLYGAAMHGDTPLDAPGSAIAAFYLNLLGHAVGWPSPRGGAGRADRRARRPPAQPRRRGPHAARGSSGSPRRAAASTGVDVAGGERLDAPVVIADVMPRRAGARWPATRLAGWYRSGAAALRLRPGDAQGRLGAGRPDPVGERRGPRRRARCTSAAARTSCAGR